MINMQEREDGAPDRAVVGHQSYSIGEDVFIVYCSQPALPPF
jgi:hypothetical protein